MNVSKYLFALWAGVFIYASLSLFFGAKGLSAYHQLERERRKQEVNMAELVSINQELGNAVNSLLYDEDTLAVYARGQGYASADERFIRIVGLGVNQKSKTYSGDVITAFAPQYAPDRTLRIIALCAGFTIFICIALSDFLRFLKDRQESPFSGLP